MDLLPVADAVRVALKQAGLEARVQATADDHVDVRRGDAGGQLALGTAAVVRMVAARVSLRPASNDATEAARWLREECGLAVTEAELDRHLPAHVGWRLVYEVPISGRWLCLETPRLGRCRLGQTRPLAPNPEIQRMSDNDAPLPADVQLAVKKVQELFDLDPNRLPDQFAEFVRWELQRRARDFTDDAVLTAAQLNDLSDRLAALERWMAQYTPHLERLARTVRPTKCDIPLNGTPKEDDV